MDVSAVSRFMGKYERRHDKQGNARARKGERPRVPRQNLPRSTLESAKPNYVGGNRLSRSESAVSWHVVFWRV